MSSKSNKSSGIGHFSSKDDRNFSNASGAMLAAGDGPVPFTCLSTLRRPVTIFRIDAINSVPVSAWIFAESPCVSGQFCNISDEVCNRFKRIRNRSKRYSPAAVSGFVGVKFYPTNRKPGAWPG